MAADGHSVNAIVYFPVVLNVLFIRTNDVNSGIGIGLFGYWYR